MAYTWKSDTKSAIAGESLLSDSLDSNKLPMYGLANNLNYIVETVNSTADTKATNCTKVSGSSRWSVQFNTTRTVPSSTSVNFNSFIRAYADDFNQLRNDIAYVRNNIGNDSSIYCSTAKTPNYSTDNNAKRTAYNNDKSNCPAHNGSIHNSRNA